MIIVLDLFFFILSLATSQFLHFLKEFLSNVDYVHSSYASMCVTVFYCTFMFLYNIVSGQLALLLLTNK